MNNTADIDVSIVKDVLHVMERMSCDSIHVVSISNSVAYQRLLCRYADRGDGS